MLVSDRLVTLSAYHLFRDLPYTGIKLLAERVRQSEKWHLLADEKSGWMNKCQRLYEGKCFIDFFGCDRSDRPLERNNKFSLFKKRALEERMSPEEQRKRQRTENTSHARPSNFQPQTGRIVDLTEDTDFDAFDPNSHLDEAFISIGQELPRPPSAVLEDFLPVECLDDPVQASTEFLENFCPDTHVNDILTDPQYVRHGFNNDEHLPQNSAPVM